MANNLKAYRSAVIETTDGWSVEIVLSDQADPETAKNVVSLRVAMEGEYSNPLAAKLRVDALSYVRVAIDNEIRRLQFG